MSNILIINSLYYPDIKGGAEYSIKSLAEALSKENNVSVLCLSKNDYIEEEEINNVRVKRIPIINFYNPFFEKKKFKFIWHLIDSVNPFYSNHINNIIKERNISTVITNNLVGFSPFVLKNIEANGKPVIHILRDYNLLCPSNMYKGKGCNSICAQCRPMYAIKKRFTNNVSKVIGISKFILDKHIGFGLFSNADQFVIPNIVNVESYSSKKDKSETDLYDFGYIGRFSKNKGVYELFDLFNKQNKYNIIIAGDTNDLFLNKYIIGHNIRIAGYIKNTDFYSKIKFTIVPSKWNEPFGRVVIESFASGKPVIARRVGGLQELIKDGENGFLFDTHSELEKLIEYCGCLSELEYQKLSFNAFETSKLYKTDTIINKYKDIID